MQPSHTQNKQREVIKNIIVSKESGKKEIVYELGMQPWFFFDFNIENIGHNKRMNESVKEYIKRVMECQYLYESKDYAFAEFCPVNMKDTNAKID